MTPHPNGELIQVSGALCVPQASECPLPLSSYQHGTVALRTDAPSFQSTEGLLCVLYASAGYLTVAADYIGLGTGEGMHLYVHAESEANTCLDLLRSAVELQDVLGYQLNDELFIWGYSQGGHATAALQRKIELEVQEEFSITASALMSGPYDISGVQANIITSDEVYSNPGYLPYVAFSYQEAYGTLFGEPSDLFIEPYATALPPLFNGEYSLGFINTQCASVPSQMLQPDVLEAFQNDPDHPIRIALRDNDVLDWAPAVPTRLYYCDADELVNYENALVAAEAFQNLGSTEIELINLGSYDHNLCAPFAMYGAYNWFESLRQDPFMTSVSANISSSGEGDPLPTGAIDVDVNAPGNWDFEWSNGSDELDLTALEAGIYTLQLISEEGCRDQYEFEVSLISGLEELNHAFEIFPNPAKDQLIIKVQYPLSCYLFNANGVLIDRFDVNSQESIDISELPAGIYFMKSTDGKGMKLAIL